MDNENSSKEEDCLFSDGDAGNMVHFGDTLDIAEGVRPSFYLWAKKMRLSSLRLRALKAENARLLHDLGKAGRDTARIDGLEKLATEQYDHGIHITIESDGSADIGSNLGLAYMIIAENASFRETIDQALELDMEEGPKCTGKGVEVEFLRQMAKRARSGDTVALVARDAVDFEAAVGRIEELERLLAIKERPVDLLGDACRLVGDVLAEAGTVVVNFLDELLRDNGQDQEKKKTEQAKQGQDKTHTGAGRE